MRLPSASLFLPLLATTVSAGWFINDKPDNANSATQAPLFEGATPEAPPRKEPKGIFSFIPEINLETILTVGPIAKLIAGTTGVNITEKFEAAKRKAAETGWHPDILMITDENYREMIVEEPLTLDEMEKRVWIILVSVASDDPHAKIVDEKFDESYNLTYSTRDKALPNVRWGRIDYMDVTRLTTKWWIWRAPYLVVCRKGGRELRFYNTRQLRLIPDVMHRFLKEEGWKETKPWSGPLAPGGSLERPLDMFASFWAYVYIVMLRVPKWIMVVVTGGLASALVNVLHRGDNNPGSSRKSASSKRARIASNAKKEDGGSPVKPISRQASPEKEDGRGRRRSQSPSKRVSARIAARSDSPAKRE